nr:hypothetical protein [Tanacetum cinerariifolium]
MTTTAAQQVALDNTLMKILSSSLRNLATKKTLNLSVKWLLIACTNHGEPLLQSSTSAYLGRLQEDFTFQIENKDHKKQEKVYYDRFTKAIIHYFITKDKSISMRNIMFMHTARDDIILGRMRFISKSDDFQVYRAVLTNRMTDQQMQKSDAYKTYLAYATGVASPKMKRKLKKHASPLKNRTLVTVEEEEPKPAKKVVSSKKPASKRQSAGGSCDGTGSTPRVPDESKGKTDSEIQETNDDEEETETNDESNDETEEEYERINKELYGDVNVRLIDVEPGDEDNGDKEMTNAETEDVDNENKDVKELKDLNKSTKVISTIQSKVPKAVKEYLGSSLDDAMHKKSVEDIQEIKIEQARKQQVPKETITSFDTTTLVKFDQKTTLFESMTKSKSFNKSPKQRALYHALMESIVDDEDAIEEGSAQAEETMFEAGATQGPQNLRDDMVNRQIISFDYFFNNDLAYLQEGSTGRTYTTLLTTTKATKYDFPGIKDMVPNLWSPVKVAYDNHALLGTSHWGPKRQSFYGYASNRESKHDAYSTKRILAMTNVKVKEWYGYGNLKDIENRLFNLKGDVIVHLVAALHMFTRRIMIQKRVEDLQLGVESYQKKLNIFRPMTHKTKITDLKPYSAYSNLKASYMWTNMANNLEMGYTSVMPRKRWSSLDKKRSHILIKDIDRQLLDRRLMRSLEKFVGGRYYEKDLGLLHRTL